MQNVNAPLNEIPIGKKTYSVAVLTRADINSLRRETEILKDSSGKPVVGEISRAYAAIIRKLIAGSHSELTDEYVESWLSPALCNMVAGEWLRQFVATISFAKAH